MLADLMDRLLQAQVLRSRTSATAQVVLLLTSASARQRSTWNIATVERWPRPATGRSAGPAERPVAGRGHLSTVAMFHVDLCRADADVSKRTTCAVAEVLLRSTCACNRRSMRSASITFWSAVCDTDHLPVSAPRCFPRS